MPTDETAAERLHPIVREAYARQVVALGAGTDDERLRVAFASVARERFLGAPPWQFGRFPLGFVSGSDPILAYQDVAFVLAAERGVNTGTPSLHARLLHHLRPEPGQTVLHLGTGTGYYSAILAHLVGREGRVVAVELDAALAAAARENLRDYANVSVVHGDATEWPRMPVDRIDVNFMVSRPADAWIEQLAPGGRLLLPIGFLAPSREKLPGGIVTVRAGSGGAFLIERGDRGFAARWVAPARFIWADGPLRASEANDAAVRRAFERGGQAAVNSLIWGDAPASPRLWFRGDGWALAFDGPGDA